MVQEIKAMNVEGRWRHSKKEDKKKFEKATNFGSFNQYKFTIKNWNKDISI